MSFIWMCVYYKLANNSRFSKDKVPEGYFDSIFRRAFENQPRKFLTVCNWRRDVTAEIIARVICTDNASIFRKALRITGLFAMHFQWSVLSVGSSVGRRDPNAVRCIMRDSRNSAMSICIRKRRGHLQRSSLKRATAIANRLTAKAIDALGFLSQRRADRFCNAMLEISLSHDDTYDIPLGSLGTHWWYYILAKWITDLVKRKCNHKFTKSKFIFRS